MPLGLVLQYLSRGGWVVVWGRDVQVILIRVFPSDFLAITCEVEMWVWVPRTRWIEELFRDGMEVGRRLPSDRVRPGSSDLSTLVH